MENDGGIKKFQISCSNSLNNLNIVLGQVAMIAGGTNGGSVNTVELYSPNGGCNFQLAPLPVQLYANFFLGRYKTLIIACMGYSDQTGSDYRNCWKYSPTTNAWSSLTGSNYFHRWRTGFLYKNLVYFVDNANPEVYNVDTNQWSAGISAPNSPNNAPCMVVYRDSVFVLGGDGYNIGNRQYNFTTQAWTNLLNLPAGFQFFGCALLPASADRLPNGPLYDDKILMMQHNGDDRAGTIYDIKNNVYLPMTPTASGHRHNFLLSLGRRVFVLSGYNGAATPVVEEYHKHNNSWTVAKSVLVARWHPSAVPVPAHWFKAFPGGCQGVK